MHVPPPAPAWLSRESPPPPVVVTPPAGGAAADDSSSDGGDRHRRSDRARDEADGWCEDGSLHQHYCHGAGDDDADDEDATVAILRGERTQHGMHILPDRGGWGPIYYSVLTRVA